MSSVVEQYYEKLMDLFFTPTGKINVPQNFHKQMEQINKLLSNDKTGLINTILDYMVHSATVDINFNSSNSKLTNLFDDWKDNVNADLNLDIPRGLRSFTQQYFRERWRSSFLVASLRWHNVNGFQLPTRIFLMDGSQVFVKNDKRLLNGNKYFLGNPDGKDNNYISLNNRGDESLIVRKPHASWNDKYPEPYLGRRGLLYHALFKMQVLERQAEIIRTAFPYQQLIKVGTTEAIKRNMGPSEEDLKAIKKKFQDKKENFDEHSFSKGLIDVFAGDVNIEELIPDYIKALDEKILRSVDKNLLYGLGLIEFRGFSSDREEAMLNPKVLVEEVKDGVNDYKDFLKEVVAQIKERNKNKYTVNDKVTVQTGSVKTFLTDDMKSLIRSLYDRGIVGQKSTLETITDLDFETQIKERKYENKHDLQNILYPRLVQNLENTPDVNEQNDDVPDDKKKDSPESKNYKNASEEIDCIKEPLKTIRSIPNIIRDELNNDQQRFFKGRFNEMFEKCTQLEYDDYLREKTSFEYAWKETKEYLQAPYDKNSDLPKNVKSPLPSEAQTLWRTVFNESVENGDSESVARKKAWSAVKKVYKKNKDRTWVKR